MRIDHVGVVVKAMSDSAAFFETLGLTPDCDLTQPTAEPRVCFFTSAELAFEAIESSHPWVANAFDPVVGSDLQLHHVALEVLDIGVAMARLGKAGVQFASSEPNQSNTQDGRTRLSVFTVPANDRGIVFQLIEYRHADRANSG